MSRAPSVLGAEPALSHLGKYRVLQKIAQGGMAEIYLARAAGIEGFEKHVVIKRIQPLYADKPRFVQMFLDEARLAARLQHQNIAQVYDIGQEGHVYYFAMEYLHGVDLRRLMKRSVIRQRPLPLEHALTIVAHTATALGYAHNATDDDGMPLEVVHRDVSPANIFITYDGAVKLVDFGIARASQRSTETRTGTLKGKISYMSPEQCKGQELDRRSDVFSLGIVLYEITTQTRLFRSRADTDYVIMDRIVNGEFDAPSARITGYPEALERIVLKALAVRRAERYGSAGELLQDLERFAVERRIPLSVSALSQYVTALCGRPPEPWKQLEDGIPIDIDLDDDDWPRTISTTGAAVNATAATVAGREWALPPPTVTPVPSDWARELSDDPEDAPAPIATVADERAAPIEPVADPVAEPVRASRPVALIAGALIIAALAGVALAFALSSRGDERRPAATSPPPAVGPDPAPASASAPPPILSEDPVNPALAEPAAVRTESKEPALEPAAARTEPQEPAPEPVVEAVEAEVAPPAPEPARPARKATRRKAAPTSPPDETRRKPGKGLIDRTW